MDPQSRRLPGSRADERVDAGPAHGSGCGEEDRDHAPSPPRPGSTEAARNADAWLSTRAATHRLDGIAGGDLTDISGVGDSGVNSSLGSQWRSRVGAPDQAVLDFVSNDPGVDRSSVFMHIALTWGRSRGAHRRHRPARSRERGHDRPVSRPSP
ncbi:polymorphic toxin type 15 domain-containing protein [Agrococcus sp. SL85]|uniref:polymorphic toxin type 15 domain-containing protein n=1 Tax=Agrococcus sp. SL85 TaxID=2995141 RepID=UPI003B63DBC9